MEAGAVAGGKDRGAAVNGITRYSKIIPGSRGNYGWTVRYDLLDGYLGITQVEGGEIKDRILLSGKQVKALLDFVKK